MTLSAPRTEPAAPFTSRHIGTSTTEQQQMLQVLGYSDLDALMADAIPGQILDETAPVLPEAAGEAQVLAELRTIAAKNTVRTSMIGQGYYGVHTPSVIARNVLENPAWYTAYTPYQPEISQGRLEALLNFQTMVCDLTGLDIAGASMLDEATAVAEAMLLARRAVKGEAGVFYVDTDTVAQTKAVLATRAAAVGIELREVDPAAPPEELDHAFGVLLSYPGASGRVLDRATVSRWERITHEAGAQLVVAADLLALTLLEAPGTWGADMVAGSSQRFGVPMGFGGPHAGYLSVRTGLQRQLPGRLVGVSKDADGQVAYRLALQTREQHIRRQKATSNICTAQVLLAVMASMYAVYHGPDGLAAIGRHAHTQALTLASRLRQAGAAVVHEQFFDTVCLHLPGQAGALHEAALAEDVAVHVADEDYVTLSCDETTTTEHLDRVLAAYTRLTGGADGADDSSGPDGVDAVHAGDQQRWGLPEDQLRTTDYLTHPVFHRYRSETAMMRYLRHLAGKDYALDRGMIPLGSCTMKLNAATEMAAVTWPQFADVHPYAPAGDVTGYLELIDSLQTWLARLTGYAAVSVQPNAGSQGELAGLLAIRRYHEARGEQERTVCVVPASAHGTNAASAVLAGLEVAIVATADNGDVDTEDLRRVLTEHEGRIAAIMVTYPSTHGVYETGITELCELVHAAGGQVYIDGANLNALVGWSGPGGFGGDVSHLNLHKTFCIPHGGGGPGVGPVAVAEHLVPYLPGHPLDPARGPAEGAVSAAPHGSPSILPISWAYLRMMGTEGLRSATAAAVLGANYLARRLGEAYPVLYRGRNGLVAHECILDVRELTARTGITVDDVAKRLIDYGFHAPTMSFPVAGTLMVEPTESEDLAELDRFVEAMLAIHAEAEQVAEGTWPADDNPLVNAPHTAAQVVGEWTHPYSREVAVHPVAAVAADKYWPPVRRVDGAYGDRNLMCSCPPVSAFEQD